MLKSKYILFAVFLLAAAGVSAQKAERDYIRKGNRLFNDSVFPRLYMDTVDLGLASKAFR